MLIMLYGNSRPHTMIWNTPLWFLPALFLVLICVYGFENGIAKIAGENQLLQLFMCLGVVVLSWGVGILFESRVQISVLPMQFESGVFMIGFVMLGILFSHLQMKERWHRQDKTRIILCAFVLLLVGIGVSTGKWIRRSSDFALWWKWPAVYSFLRTVGIGVCVTLLRL